MPRATKTPRTRQTRTGALASGNGSDDEWAWWHEEIKKPEYRLKIWAWQALAAAFVGDEHNMNYYTKLAEQEKATITARQNEKLKHGGE